MASPNNAANAAPGRVEHSFFNTHGFAYGNDSDGFYVDDYYGDETDSFYSNEDRYYRERFFEQLARDDRARAEEHHLWNHDNTTCGSGFISDASSDEPNSDDEEDPWAYWNPHTDSELSMFGEFKVVIDFEEEDPWADWRPLTESEWNKFGMAMEKGRFEEETPDSFWV